MLRGAAACSVIALAMSAGCGGGTNAETSAAPACTDSGFTETVPPRVLDLERAVIQVGAGHGDIALLDAAAPGLVAAAGAVLATARVNAPCDAELVRADTKVLSATKALSSAGHALAQLTAAAKAGKDYARFGSSFLASYYAGADALEAALTALRNAGIPPLVKATDGRDIFLEAGCSTCHTLAAAGAKGTAGPSLDDARPSATAVVGAVTDGQGVMLSFKGLLTMDQIHAVAAFVDRSSGALQGSG